MAATVGLDFRLQDAHPANTFRAHRLLHFAATRDLGNELTERLMRGYFSEGVRIGDRDELVAPCRRGRAGRGRGGGRPRR